jgi:SAM-dependent methyltransferase
MSSRVTRYGVLIASPSDVREERDIAVETINRWNIVNWGKGIQYIPLRYETGAVPTLSASPQGAINEQLLSKADYLIGIFWSRLGTPTEDYPSGTAEEIERAVEGKKAAVFFREQMLEIKVDDPKAKEKIEQARLLKRFKGKITGFTGSYKNASELGIQIFQQLEHWANQAESQPPCIKVHQEPSDYQSWLREWGRQGRKGTVLLYNIELNSLREFSRFNDVWGVLRELPSITQVVLLLPRYKIRRLRRYLKNWGEARERSDVAKLFHVCEFASSSDPGRHRVTTGLAFALFRLSMDPGFGEVFPIGHIFGLSEPFSTARRGETGDPDLVWTYKYSLEIREERGILGDLIQIWNEEFNRDGLTELTEMSFETQSDIPPDKGPPFSPDWVPSEKTAHHIIRVLKEKLFDPNVPSYLLDKKFSILDWNAAFEMIFPTSQFYRKEQVKEFVECLENRDEVIQHGSLFRDDPQLLFDMEVLLYQSPQYGHMRFTKIASEVRNPIDGEILGWIVALNVDEVENLERYEVDLKRTNEEQALMTLYAQPFDRVISDFPGYIALVDLHAKVMGEARADRVLVLGSGPGVLVRRLLEAGKKVTAVDQNDTMLGILRGRCLEFSQPQLSIVKANINTLHVPNPRYAPHKIGIGGWYDGALMLNVFRWLTKPEHTLKVLAQHFLRQDSAIAFSLYTEQEEIDAFYDALRQYSIEKHEAGEPGWSGEEYETLTGVTKNLEDRGLLVRYSEDDVREIVRNAGYEIKDRLRASYSVDGERYETPKVFVARPV